MKEIYAETVESMAGVASAIGYEGGRRRGPWRRVESRLLLAIAFALTTFSVCAQTGNVTPATQDIAISIYAAGSLREVMGTLERAFQDEQGGKREIAFQSLYGPSGKLRERIETGETTHLFASASPVHTEKLVESGKLRSSTLFASNSLCAIFRHELRLTEQNFVQMLLAEQTRVGTSTPGADPSGDYTWEMFRKIGATQSGAFEILDRKALKLTGAEIGSQSATESPYARLVLDRTADVFITYCTNARLAQKASPALQWLTVPAQFDVATRYAVGLAHGAPDSAREFLRYMLSQRAQTLMTGLGFSPPPLKCERVDDGLKATHAAWLMTPRVIDASARTPTAAAPPEVGLRQKYRVNLSPGNTLAFVKRPGGAMGNRFGGAVSFTADETGHLELFLDRRGWIDMVRAGDGKRLDSLRADRWLGCAGVGKNLGFAVEKGKRYELLLSEIEVPQVEALIMPIANPPASGAVAPVSRSGS